MKVGEFLNNLWFRSLLFLDLFFYYLGVAFVFIVCFFVFRRGFYYRLRLYVVLGQRVQFWFYFLLGSFVFLGSSFFGKQNVICLLLFVYYLGSVFFCLGVSLNVFCVFVLLWWEMVMEFRVLGWQGDYFGFGKFLEIEFEIRILYRSFIVF